MKKKILIILLLFFTVFCFSFLVPGRAVIYNATPMSALPAFEIVKATVTAYSSDPAETDDTPTITASGKDVAPGTVACPKSLKFGTKIEILGEVYVCWDRMHERYQSGNYFDIWHASKNAAIKFGRQVLNVKIIKQ